MSGRIILCEDIGDPRHPSRCLVIDPDRPRATDECDPRCGRYVQPEGYGAAADWADEMLRDFWQLQCPGCGRWTIWVPLSLDNERGGAS